ncbi:MAG: GDSL-type esterase/lipase family protein [Huintestinicola sp.]|uniref:SGNH/GDSL hydrolase family protein n=1 Tax=Huintestinicola sp. TaxID=2981661 RepID=UPI003F022336
MKKRIAATAVLLSAIMLASCGNTENPPAESIQTEETRSVSETTKAPETPEEFHKAMVDRSLYSLGNTSRLKAKMEQARSGEKTTVAYIGGSITEGVGANADSCYARLSYEFFRDTYGTGDNVEYVNAGLSGTPSNLGVLRLERDVLSYSPDIVFVEFAVNDSQDDIAKESYESLVRTVLEQENAPAVVLIFNVIESGYTAQAHMKEIGEHYELPMVSAADALTPEFEEGRMTWKEYSGDKSHPNTDGHKLLCEFIENLLTSAENSADSGEYTLPDIPKFGTAYKNAALATPEAENDKIVITETGSFEAVQSGTSGFPCSWKYKGGNEPLKLNTTANAFFVIFKRNNSDTMGSFDVYMNGAKLKTVNTNQSDGWGEAFSQQVIKFQSVKDMDIEIVPSEGNGDRTIEILGFASSSNE